MGVQGGGGDLVSTLTTCVLKSEGNGSGFVVK